MGRNRLWGLAGLVLLLPCTSAFASLWYNDGGHYIINTYLGDSVFIDEGFPGQETTVEVVISGQVGDVRVFEDGVFSLNGGTCDTVMLYDNSEAFINGTHHRLALFDNSTMHIYNSLLTPLLNVYDTAKVILYGYDFTIDGQSYGNGTYSVTDLPPVLSIPIWKLAGYFENGNAFEYWTILDTTAQLTLVPEPTTLALLGIGGLWLRKRRL